MNNYARWRFRLIMTHQYQIMTDLREVLRWCLAASGVQIKSEVRGAERAYLHPGGIWSVESLGSHYWTSGINDTRCPTIRNGFTMKMQMAMITRRITNSKMIP